VLNATENVGTTPWTTAKFEEVKKQLVSPCVAPEKTSNDPSQKSTAPYTPVLDK
jgi:hypothetical protein